MKVAIHIGISINDYNEMTPHELGLYVQIYNDKKKNDYDEKLTLTYMGAYWARIKRMPSLKQVLKDNETKEEMSPEGMLKQVKALNTALGGTNY